MRNKYDTYYVKEKDKKNDWVVVDATSKNLGRLASQVAAILRGKNKAMFQPSVDVGDSVIVTNIVKMKVTGKKFENKIYNWYTGYPGGIKSKKYSIMMSEKPERIFYLAVKRMLPKGPIGSAMLRKLRIFQGSEHKHEAQKPKVLELSI